MISLGFTLETNTGFFFQKLPLVISGKFPGHLLGGVHIEILDEPFENFLKQILAQSVEESPNGNSLKIFLDKFIVAILKYF